MTGGRSSTSLRVIIQALKGASRHGDESSIVHVSWLVLQLWAEKLKEIEEGRSRGAPGKALLHANWAVRYWECRADKPSDIDGAIRNVQDLTRGLYPWESAPTAATIKRVARKHRTAVFDTIRNSRNLKPLLSYLCKHEKRGRE